MVREQRAVLCADDPWLRPVTFAAAAPGPGVAEPERRQHVQCRGVRTVIRHDKTYQRVVRGILGVFREHVEVAVVVKHARVGQFKLRIVPAAAPVLLDEPLIGKLGLRIFVERLAVRVRRRRVEVEITFLDVLAVVALRVGQAKQALLQNRIATIPQRQCEAEAAFAIAQAEQTILAPAVGAAAGVVVREILPARPVRRVILAHGAPLPFGEIRPPALPVFSARAIFREPNGFGG